MKKIILIGILCAGVARASYAQALTTWVEQLSALQTLGRTVKQGYTTMTSGLRNIGDIKEEEFDLHSSYFGSLSTVNPAVGQDPILTEVQQLIHSVTQRLQNELQYWRNQTPITQP